MKFWDTGIKGTEFISLNKNIETDVLIIGGGITGLTLGYFLKDENIDVTLIDKGILMNGVTSKTTAKITYLQGTIYQILINNFNELVAKKYLSSQKEAIKIIEKIVKKENINCDLKKCSSIVFALNSKNIKKIELENKILKSFGVKTEQIFNDKIKSGFQVSDTYVFNPLKYLNGIIDKIKDKIKIYEHVLAQDIKYKKEKYFIKTNKGVIKAKIVVVACHYPFFIIPSFLPLKTYIKREYVNVSKISDIKNFSAINVDEDLHSIRFYNDYIIYGSNQNNLYADLDYQKQYDKSKNDFNTYFMRKPSYTWMNQDIMSNDNLPFIGSIKQNLYMSTAYNAWGMTNATIGAKIIADNILQGYSKYNNLFDPKRLNKTLIITSFIKSFNYFKVYLQSLIKKNNPSYIKINGIFYGIYKDQLGYLHKIKLVCPHMKCNLVFNKEEKTWDCPCHGSRFDLDGNLLEGPSKKTYLTNKIYNLIFGIVIVKY